jgi:hypothetical protein
MPISYQSAYLERVASTKTRTEGESLRALAEHIRTPLFAPEGKGKHLCLPPEPPLYLLSGNFYNIM